MDDSAIAKIKAEVSASVTKHMLKQSLLQLEQCQMDLLEASDGTQQLSDGMTQLEDGNKNN